MELPNGNPGPIGTGPSVPSLDSRRNIGSASIVTFRGMKGR